MYISLIHTAAAALLSTVISISSHACPRGPISGRGIEARNYTAPPDKKIAITNVKVFDGQRILPPTTVVIDGGKIGLVGMSDSSVDETIDGESGVLLPGLFDSHNHPESLDDLQRLTSYGITTTFSMSCYPIDICNTLRDQVGLTAFYTGGDSATSPGSFHSKLPGYPQDQLIRSASDATWFVANRVGNNSDWIKLVAESGGMNQSEHNALVAEAKRYNMLVATHTTDFYGYQMAIASGTDWIQHMPADKLLTQENIKSMIEQGMASVPTLIIDQVYTEDLKPPGYNFSTSSQNVKNLYDAGIPIMAGTDAHDGGAGFGVVLTFGDSLHAELELLYQAGLNTTYILQAATSRPAKYFGLTDRGSIEPGKRADLLLIKGDPIANISNTRNIQRVWVGGIEFHNDTTSY